jgi:RNA polymerase sigma-70 factor (ECF subfamily)
MSKVEPEPRLLSLMIASQAGDAGAHRMLLAALAPRLRAYFQRRLGSGAADAEDLVQETLISIHRRRDSFRPDLPLLAWVHGIARYRLIDHFRRTGRRREVPLEDAGPLGQVFTAAMDSRLDTDRMLAALPSRDQALLRSTRIEGRSVAEAAAGSGLSEGAAKVAIHRALRRLEVLFGGKS